MLQPLKNVLKTSALTALRATGAYARAANSKSRSEKLLILCYHGLSLRDEHEWAGHLFITPERFRQRLQCLQDIKANVLPLSEAIERLNAGKLPPRSVAITFDDGFYDFLAHAVPIVSAFGFPCTLYLTTYYSGRRMPIVNLALDYLIWKSGSRCISFPEQGLVTEMDTSNWQGRIEVVRRLGEWFDKQNFTTEQKDDFARSLAGRFGIDYEELLRSRLLQIMTPEEASRAANAGIDIQLHTHRHRTPRDQRLFEREIIDNRARIAEITGSIPDHFCYPSGVYADEFLPWLRNLAVKTATTCERGFATPANNRLLLPRLLDDSNLSLLQFEAFVSGVLS
jgi:peptidoglycan/xylan/chitin deacetylase (PgdA/CDA1 family)